MMTISPFHLTIRTALLTRIATFRAPTMPGILISKRTFIPPTCLMLDRFKPNRSLHHDPCASMLDTGPPPFSLIAILLNKKNPPCGEETWTMFLTIEVLGYAGMDHAAN